jgi:ribonucleoside-diphosphate reductase alpha chain
MKKSQCSSCFLLGTEDSLDGIFKTITDSARISKWAGGIGIHISNIRAKGSIIKSTNGKSDGIIPMLKVYNETAKYINQSGKRNGSIAVYLEPWHADVWEFIELKKNTGIEQKRARDLFLALWIPDIFMEIIQNNKDEDWYLMCPNECPGLTDTYGEEFNKLYYSYVEQKKYKKVIKAQILWRHILESQMETGVPYILFKDNINRKSNHKNIGIIKSSNLCAEVVLFSDNNEYAVCNLASIAVNKFIKKVDNKYEVDYEELHKVSQLITYNLDRVIDINHYPTEETKKSNMKNRPIGIGIQGLGNLLCALKIPYDSNEAVELNATIMETIYHGALVESNNLSKKIGPYETFKGSPFSQGKFQFDLWIEEGKLNNIKLSDKYNWNHLKQNIIEHGVRNSMLTALMPTASTSQILGNVECFEPYSSNIYKRTTLAGEFMVVNRQLMADLMELNLWNDNLREEIIMNDGSVQNINVIPEHIKKIYKTVWEIKQKYVIDHALARSPFVDQSQSMNLFLDKPDYVKLSSALTYGWKNGIKTGCYYLRSKPATEAIKYAIDVKKNQNENDNACDLCSA